MRPNFKEFLVRQTETNSFRPLCIQGSLLASTVGFLLANSPQYDVFVPWLRQLRRSFLLGFQIPNNCILGCYWRKGLTHRVSSMLCRALLKIIAFPPRKGSQSF